MIAILVLAAALTLFAAETRAQRVVAQADTSRPRIKYADSLVSINDRCAVAKAKLNPRVFPVYVNGRPVGFC